uniref:Uncharacterized protein n=1 Tax=Onchocerca volvulus TaxID=6282 RepID=A0A8R1TT61_ONCVO
MDVYHNVFVLPIAMKFKYWLWLTVQPTSYKSLYYITLFIPIVEVLTSEFSPVLPPKWKFSSTLLQKVDGKMIYTEFIIAMPVWRLEKEFLSYCIESSVIKSAQSRTPMMIRHVNQNKGSEYKDE